MFREGYFEMRVIYNDVHGIRQSLLLQIYPEISDGDISGSILRTQCVKDVLNIFLT